MKRNYKSKPMIIIELDFGLLLQKVESEREWKNEGGRDYLGKGCLKIKKYKISIKHANLAI